MSVASLHGVELRYGRHLALADFDLEIQADTLSALVGPNGAGKTSTLKAICGLTEVSAGSVRVLGLDPISDALELRRRLAFLPDRPTLPAHLRVIELIRLRAALYGIAIAEAEAHFAELSRLLGTEDFENRPCGTLSHGEGQRVALITALISSPELLLVDEPMTALDLEAQHAVRRLLRAQVESGVAVVLTTHTAAHVAALADDIIAIDHGRVIGRRGRTPDVAELESWLLGKEVASS